MTDQHDVSENLSLPSQLSNPADAVDPIDKILAAFPLKIDKQAFVVSGGAPLQADGDDEFLSFKKVNAALGEIRALASQARAALTILVMERAALLESRNALIEENGMLHNQIADLSHDVEMLRAETNT